MSFRSVTPEERLVRVRVQVEPRSLEALLEALASVSFPINPQIYHRPETAVEFPAYASSTLEVEQALERPGLESARVERHELREVVGV